MNHIIWVGPRFSDIESIDAEFVGYIVLHGGQNDPFNFKYSYNAQSGSQFNINKVERFQLINDFYAASIADVVGRYPDVLFVFYGKPPATIKDRYTAHIPYANSQAMLRYLSDKFESRYAASLHIPVIESSIVWGSEVHLNTLRTLRPEYVEYVVQRRLSAGGYGTFLLSADIDCTEVFLPDESLVVSPYRRNSISVNQHVIVQSESILLPPSIQIVVRDGYKFQYAGCDFKAYTHLAAHHQLAVREYSRLLADWLYGIGYRGIIGFDYLISNDKVELIEFNCRFQSSTFVMNQILALHRLPSVQQLHVAAFRGESLSLMPINFEIHSGANYFSPIGNARHSMFKGSNEFISPDVRESFHNKGRLSINIVEDNYHIDGQMDDGSQSIKYQFSESICAVDYEGKLVVKPALPILHLAPAAIVGNVDFAQLDNNHIAMLKFRLLSMGMRICEEASAKLYSNRDKLTIRDGIAGGLEIVLAENVHINVPIKESFCFVSPFELRYRDGFFLAVKGQYLLPIEVIDLPVFVGEKTRSGKLMETVGQVFTDRLSINPFRGCRYNKGNKKACRFCAVGSGPMAKNADIEDIGELIQFVKSHPQCNVKHVLISGGSPIPSYWEYYLDVVKAVKEVIDIPLYIMIEPPEVPGQLAKLHHAGVDEIGINMEFWDDDIAKAVMPGKGIVTRQTYLDVLTQAVGIWGSGGPVRSILIVGIEPIANTLEAVRQMAKIGVLPILSPFRPIPLTPLAHHPSPEPELLYQVWREAQAICETYGMMLGPTCIACQNNTITLPFGPLYHYY